MKKKIVAPMSMDCNMGAIRAIYPLKNTLCISHGSTGCSFYPRVLFAWHDNYYVKLLSTGIEEDKVVFGGEKLLEEALLKAAEAIDLELIVIQNTCIPALTGDDSEGIAKTVSKKTGIKIISTRNPNYKGTQLDGYKNVVNHYATELMEKPEQIEKKSVNLVGVMPGEYNWRSNLREMKRILNSIGLYVKCTLVGDETSVNDLINAPRAEANILVHPEVGLSAAKLMKERFGTPYIETVFPPVGVESAREWILKIADFFGLKRESEVFIEEEMRAMGKALSELEFGFFNLHFLFGKRYAIQAAPFQIPPMVKFLYEDLSMIPTTIAFQEYDQLSFKTLEDVIKKYNLFPKILTSGDYHEFLNSVKQDNANPNSAPWVLFGSSVDALNSALGAFSGVGLPVIRFSYPVLDEAILTHRPFFGFPGVVFLTEKIHNASLQRFLTLENVPGNILQPLEIPEAMDQLFKKFIGQVE